MLFERSIANFGCKRRMLLGWKRGVDDDDHRVFITIGSER